MIVPFEIAADPVTWALLSTVIWRQENTILPRIRRLEKTHIGGENADE